MPSKPENSDEVYQTMSDYSDTKGFNCSESELRFMAENMFLTFEAKKWRGTSYWPPLAMRWVLTNRKNTGVSKTPQQPKKGKSVREKILEQQNEV